MRDFPRFFSKHLERNWRLHSINEKSSSNPRKIKFFSVVCTQNYVLQLRAIENFSKFFEQFFLIVAVILIGTWGLLKDSVKLGLNAVPAHIDEGAVRAHLAALPGVTAVHDLHIWPMSTTETALTAHLVMPGRPAPDSFLRDVAASLEQRFGVGHATLQVESGENPCGGCC